MNIDFSTLPQWTNKSFYPLWFDQHRFIIKKGGAGCFTKNQLIVTNKGNIPISEIKKNLVMK